MIKFYGVSSKTMYFEWGNEGKVWESCTSYAIIRVIPVRVMRRLLYYIYSILIKFIGNNFERVITMDYLLFSADDQCGRSSSWRIVDGEVTTPKEYPWIVSLQENGKHRCGGSILDVNTIVTAGHCFLLAQFKLSTNPIILTSHWSNKIQSRSGVC